MRSRRPPTYQPPPHRPLDRRNRRHHAWEAHLVRCRLGAAVGEKCKRIGGAGGECDFVEVFGESIAVFEAGGAVWLEYGGGEVGGAGCEYYLRELSLCDWGVFAGCIRLAR